MGLLVILIAIVVLSGVAFIGLCECDAIWRAGGTPPILMWVSLVGVLTLSMIAVLLHIIFNAC